MYSTSQYSETNNVGFDNYNKGDKALFDLIAIKTDTFVINTTVIGMM